MKKIYFVRHGQSVWNVEDKICGRSDSPLTEEGHNQAILTANKILKENIRIDEIICSPLSRALDTAKHISEICNIPMKIDERLIEQNFGKWEGHSPRNDEAFYKAKLNFIDNFENGESMFKVAQRIYNVLDDLGKDNKTYLIVAHNGIVRFVKSYFENMSNEDFAKYAVRNCSITKFEYR